MKVLRQDYGNQWDTFSLVIVPSGLSLRKFAYFETKGKNPKVKTKRYYLYNINETKEYISRGCKEGQ